MVRRHKKMNSFEDFLNYEIDLSKIDFNKEVFTLDDVLGMEIDLGKLASTMALFLVVSVVPVFSYGISEAYINQDLGFIEKDSELLAENVYVSNIISAYRAVFAPQVAEAQVVTSTTTTNLILNKSSYVWGETIQISFDSSAATTLSIKLRSPKVRFISDIAVNAPVKVGKNVFKYYIPSFGFPAKGSTFQITLNGANGGVVNQTSLFEIATSTLSVVQTASSSTLISPKEAEFTRDFTVKANTGTVYLYTPETFSIKLNANVRTSIPTVLSKVVTNIDTGEVLDGEVEIAQGETLNLRLKTYVVSQNNSARVVQKISGIYYHEVAGTEDELWTNGFHDLNPLVEKLEKY